MVVIYTWFSFCFNRLTGPSVYKTPVLSSFVHFNQQIGIFAITNNVITIQTALVPYGVYITDYIISWWLSVVTYLPGVMWLIDGCPHLNKIIGISLIWVYYCELHLYNINRQDRLDRHTHTHTYTHTHIHTHTYVYKFTIIIRVAYSRTIR